MYASGTGFVLILIGFVLPWFSISCGGVGKLYTGIGLVQEGGICLLLVLPIIAALIGLLAVLKAFGNSSTDIWKASAWISPLFFICTFLAVMGEIASGFKASLGDILQSLAKDMVRHPEETYGLWVTFSGYLTSLLGGMDILDKEPPSLN